MAFEGLNDDALRRINEIKDSTKEINDAVKSTNKLLSDQGNLTKEVSQQLFEVRNTKSDKLRNKRLYGGKNKSGKIPEKWKYLIDSDFKINYKCCDALKKWPSRKFEKEYKLLPFIGTMVSDSTLRKQKYLRKGCNIFDGKKKESLPLSIWLEEDVWEYIKLNNLNYSSIYDKGYKNTGC